MTNKEIVLNEIKSLEHKLIIYEKEISNPFKVDVIKTNIEVNKLILKDLEELEELKKIMGTPIQDIMKRLKVLEIIKKWSFLDTFYREDTDTTYDRFLCNIHTKGMKEDYKKVKEWLENEK